MHCRGTAVDIPTHNVQCVAVMLHKTSERLALINASKRSVSIFFFFKYRHEGRVLVTLGLWIQWNDRALPGSYSSTNNLEIYS